MAWEESWALIAEEPPKINAHVLACDGRVNHHEGWMDMQTCVGSGLPRLVWLFSTYGVLVTVNAGGGNGTCAEETPWLHGFLRCQLEMRIQEDRCQIRQGHSEPASGQRLPPLSCWERAPGESTFYGQREGLGTRISFCHILGQMVDSF